MSDKEKDYPYQKNTLLYLSQFYGNLSISETIKKSVNESYFLRSQKAVKFVLQKNDSKRRPEILTAEYKFIDYLQSKNFPGVNAIKLNSQPFFRCDGYYYSLYPFLHGNQLNLNNPNQVRRAFESIGQFLSLSSRYKNQERTWKEKWWNIDTYPFENNFKKYLDEVSYSQPIKDIYRLSKPKLFKELISPAREGKLQRGIIHSDFRPEHFIFENNKLKGIIDWTSAHQDVLIMEFARPFLHLCHSSEQRNQLIINTMGFLNFSSQEIKSAYYSSLLLELIEFIWIIKNREKFSKDDFNKELRAAIKRVIKADGISKEI